MIICFNCGLRTKEIMDKLISDGLYTDYAEIIEVAVSNLSVLEFEVQRRGAISLSRNDPVIRDGGSPEYEPAKGTDFQFISGHRDLPSSEESISIPSLFSLRGIETARYYPINMPDDRWLKGQDVPISRWVFGQYNRLLPAKVNTRALAHLLNGNSKGVDLREAMEQIVNQAAILGDYLKVHDARYINDRDDMLATAFPSTGSGGEKSRLRYASQFVGSFNSSGRLSGLLIDLKLINRSGERSERINLTEAGLRFAKLENPVLEESQIEPMQKFSTEEIEFLVKHIAEKVPVEDYAFRLILQAIKSDSNTPDTMDDFLRSNVKALNEREISRSLWTTQRSGVISRMTDLDLIKRVRDGVRVLYATTERGEFYLKN